MSKKLLNILVTAGPTREFFDPVRFLSNPSSGKMGYAVAAAAHARGHKVFLISGPTALPDPIPSKKISRITSARDMHREVLKRFSKTDVVIMTAAVSDYRPKKIVSYKVKKTGNEMTIELVPNPDILAELGKKKKKGQILVGFAAETKDFIKNASAKIKKKNLNYIVVNNVKSSKIGFGADQNEVVIIDAQGHTQKISLASKILVARKILELIQS